MIQINRGKNSTQMPQNRQIVRVVIVSRTGENVLVDINGQKMQAHLDTDISDSFLALVQVNGKNIHLRVLDSFQHTKEYQNLMQQEYLDRTRDFLVSSGLPLSGDFVEDALFLIKYGLPLEKSILKLFHYSKLRFDRPFASFLLSLIQKGLSVNEQDSELLYHLDQILEKWVKEIADPSIPPDKTHNKENLLKIMEEILSFQSEQPIHYTQIKDDRGNIFLRKRNRKKLDEKNTWTFDLSPTPDATAWLKITKNNQNYKGTLILENSLYKKTNSIQTEKLQQKIHQKTGKILKLNVKKNEPKNIHPFAEEILIPIPEGATGINIFV